VPEDESENKNIGEMRERLAELERENRDIKGVISQIAHANLLSDTLQRGFECVVAELQPLRDLAPKRASVDPRIADAAAGMLKAMEGVVLPGGSLGIPEVNVPFIGQPREPVDGCAGRPGAAALPPAGQANPDQAPLSNQQRYSQGNRP